MSLVVLSKVGQITPVTSNDKCQSVALMLVVVVALVLFLLLVLQLFNKRQRVTPSDFTTFRLSICLVLTKPEIGHKLRISS